MNIWGCVRAESDFSHGGENVIESMGSINKSVQSKILNLLEVAMLLNRTDLPRLTALLSDSTALFILEAMSKGYPNRACFSQIQTEISEIQTYHYWRLSDEGGRTTGRRFLGKTFSCNVCTFLATRFTPRMPNYLSGDQISDPNPPRIKLASSYRTRQNTE